MDFTTSQRKPKRVRSAFTTPQIEFLEEQFKKSPYISSEHRKQLAFVLKIQERAIKIWFQNRRMREKKDLIKEDGERNKNKESQQQLNNVCATQLANDRPSCQVKTEPVVVRSDNVDKPVSVQPKATTTVLSHFFEPSNVDNKPVTVDQKAKTTVLSHFFEPPVNMDDKLSGAKSKSKSHTVLSHFFEQYKHSSHPSLRKSTATTPTKKMFSVLSDCKPYKLNGNYNLNMKAVQNNARKNLCSKVKSSPNISRKLPRSCVKTAKPANVRKPAFEPMMQTMYSPIPPPASLVWKPVNILPAPGTPMNTYGIPQGPPSQQKKCCCNCTQTHSSSSMYGPGVNINNSPYHQYVLSLPFQNHGPSF